MTKRQVEYICLTLAAVGLSAFLTGMAAAEDPQATKTTETTEITYTRAR